jgi:hypothetical protein
MKLMFWSIVSVMVLFVLDVTTMPVNAIQAPKHDEIDAMLQRVERNIETATEVTQIAKETADKMVEEKVIEKKEMTEQMELLETVCEVYAVPVPESMEELEYEMRADSIRVANMKKINEKDTGNVQRR